MLLNTLAEFLLSPPDYELEPEARIQHVAFLKIKGSRFGGLTSESGCVVSGAGGSSGFQARFKKQDSSWLIAFERRYDKL